MAKKRKSAAPAPSSPVAMRIAAFMRDVAAEYDGVVAKHGSRYHSCHEGWAVLLEEVDELWDEVRKKRKNRNPYAMRAECVQIATCALKFALTFGAENLN